MGQVYVLVGTEGEYSSRMVWIAGVFSEKQDAVKFAERTKHDDRGSWPIWVEWVRELAIRIDRSGKRWDPRTASLEGLTRAETVAALDMPPEPPQGSSETEYYVMCVPINRIGRWDWSDGEEVPDDGPAA